jgi:hypothetical protein
VVVEQAVMVMLAAAVKVTQAVADQITIPTAVAVVVKAQAALVQQTSRPVTEELLVTGVTETGTLAEAEAVQTEVHKV